MCKDALSTLDKRLIWDTDTNSCCRLCGNVIEFREHQFFSCSFSSQVLRGVMAKNKHVLSRLGWVFSLKWICNRKSKALSDCLMVMSWKACIYEIWHERNIRMHHNTSRDPASVIASVLKWIQMHFINLKVRYPYISVNRRIIADWGLHLPLI